MLEEIRAKFLPRFVEEARAHVRTAIGLVGDPSQADQVRREAHQLAGEAGMLGLTDLATQARKIEASAKRWLNDGDVRAQSECARGLRTLSRSIDELEVDAPAGSPSDTAKVPASKQGRILLLDDSEIVLEQVGNALQSAGFSIASATAVAKAVAEVEKQIPDLVLTDLHLPNVELSDVCSQLRAAAGDRPLSIWVISGLSEAELHERTRGLEIAGVISKQAGVEAIIGQVQRTLSARGS